MGLGDLFPMVANALKLSGQAGPHAFTALESARISDPNRPEDPKSQQLQEIQRILGPGQAETQNQLAGVQRFLEGQRLAKDKGPIDASLMNLIYALDKGASQALGQPQRIFTPALADLTGIEALRGPNVQFGPATSDETLANFLAAQAGISAETPLMQRIFGFGGTQ
jgi:hypothetical protein